MTTSTTRRGRKAKPADLLDPSDLVAGESEKACLAGLAELLIREVATFDEIAAPLAGEMFATDAAGVVFNALAAARANRPDPALADVLEALRRQAAQDGVDWHDDPAKALLTSLVENTTYTGLAAERLTRQAAAEVRETFARRRTILALGDALHRIREHGTTPDDIRRIGGRLTALGDVMAGFKGGEAELVLQAASEIPPKPINWLWPQRISLGALTIITGPVGISKSTLTLDIAARVTTGGKWPDGAGSSPLGDVILVGSEDDPGKVVIPRLTAAGADPARVHICRGVRRTAAEQLDPLLIERDLELVRRRLAALPDVRMIVFDPLSENVEADENSNAQIRAALQPLVALAQELNVAIVAVLHQSKKTDLSLVQRIAGASSYVQLGRHILGVMNDPDDDTVGMERRRVMVVAKNSYGEERVGQKYRVTTRLSGQPGIEWIAGVVEVDADRIATRPTGGARHADAQSEAVDAMRAILADGERPAADVHAEMAGQGFSRRQIDHAANRLGIQKHQEGRRWIWRLPTVPAADDATGCYSFEEWTG
jgi:putative DNA primase/helicase